MACCNECGTECVGYLCETCDPPVPRAFTQADLDRAVEAARREERAKVASLVAAFDKYHKLLTDQHLADCQFCRDEPDGAYCPNEMHREYVELIYEMDAIRSRGREGERG